MYDFKVNLYGNMGITVVAENPEEAKRILEDTLESITVKDIKEKITNRETVEIKDSSVKILSELQKDKDRSAER